LDYGQPRFYRCSHRDASKTPALILAPTTQEISESVQSQLFHFYLMNGAGGMRRHCLRKSEIKDPMFHPGNAKHLQRCLFGRECTEENMADFDWMKPAEWLQPIVDQSKQSRNALGKPRAHYGPWFFGLLQAAFFTDQGTPSTLERQLQT
jgi:hypothetical protein